MNKRLFAQLAVIALATAGTVAQADTVQDKFQVTMQITSVCKIANAVNNIDLGDYAVGSHDAPQGKTAIEINCTKGTPFSVGLLPSNGNQEGVGEMKGVQQGDIIPYALYSDSNFSTQWGNADGKNRVAMKGEGMTTKPLVLPVYAQAKGTDYAPDKYLDTVVVSVDY